MKHFFKKKTFIITFLIYLIAISLSLFIVIFLKKGTIPADARATENISGWAWNNQAGWISFNSLDCDPDDDGFADYPPDGCPVSPTEPIPAYGVNIDTAGNFSGYAWSSNAGWISFNRTDTGNPPAAPFNGGSGPIAFYSTSTKQVSGWAKILHLGSDGWIKLRDSGTVNYGVYLDAGGQFRNWGWNGNDDTLGLGWVAFNCLDTPELCAGHNYHVQAKTPTRPVISSVATTTFADSCSTLQVNWNSGVQYHDGFTVVRDGSAAGGACAGNLAPGVVSCIDNSLSPGVNYSFTVSAYNVFGASTSQAVVGQTNPICQVIGGPGIVARAECPNIVHLDWQIPANQGGVDHYILRRCNSTSGDCAISNFVDITSGPCYNPVANRCDDNSISTSTQESVTSKYRYQVAGVNGAGEQGDWSASSNEVRPCPRLPIWLETQAQ